MGVRGGLVHQLRGALHGLPVVFVGGSAGHADLVMTSIFIDAGPGEAVSAGAVEELIQKFQWLTPWFLFRQWSIHRVKNGLCWSCKRPCRVESKISGGCDLETNESTDFSFFCGKGP